jgi:hypothetical protein
MNCPQCNEPCSRDEVDIGVGVQTPEDDVAKASGKGDY